jgi:hypothetical protein
MVEVHDELSLLQLKSYLNALPEHPAGYCVSHASFTDSYAATDLPFD